MDLIISESNDHYCSSGNLPPMPMASGFYGLGKAYRSYVSSKFIWNNPFLTDLILENSKWDKSVQSGWVHRSAKHITFEFEFISFNDELKVENVGKYPSFWKKGAWKNSNLNNFHFAKESLRNSNLKIPTLGILLYLASISQILKVLNVKSKLNSKKKLIIRSDKMKDLH